MKITADNAALKIHYRTKDKLYTSLVNEATSDPGNGPFDDISLEIGESVEFGAGTEIIQILEV